MSLSITGYLWSLAVAWMSTKAAPFGHMIARGEFQRLDRLFFRTLWQALSLLVVMALCSEVGFLGARKLLPQLSARLVSPVLFSILLLAALATFLIQSLAVYLRAHKSEPFLVQSMVIAVTTLVGALLSVRLWGSPGIAATYVLCAGGGLVSGTIIFQSKRNLRSQTA
jgi:hypothetical protein